MSRFLKNIFILIIIIVFIFAFSSSYLSLSIDNLAYVLAIGIDKSDENKLLVSFQFSNTTSPTESGTTQKTPSILNSVTASSISTAINLMNSYLGKEINLSHCKIIIFSEELAAEGISDEIYTLTNDTQIRPSANIVVSKCSAKYYMKNTVPELENLISKYYEIFTNSSTYTGFMPNATIGKFYNSLISNTCEPYAILGGLSSENEEEHGANYQENYTIKANESPIQGKTGSENIGIAVFKDDKIVGELNALETIVFLNLGNDINRFLISIPDPTNSNRYLDIYLTPRHPVKISVNTSNSAPYIKVKSTFLGRIYSMSENSKYLNPEVLDSISNACDNYLESVFLDYLYKTSKNYKSDINELGKYALDDFLTTQEFNNYNWTENYENAFFDVEINTSVKSGMLITET